MTRWRARACACSCFNFEKELFAHVNMLESRGMKGTDKQLEKARAQIRDRLTQLAPIFLKNKYMLGDDFSMLDVCDRSAAVAPGLLRHRHVEERRAAAQVRRAHLLAPGLHRGADAVRKGDAPLQVSACALPPQAPVHGAGAGIRGGMQVFRIAHTEGRPSIPDKTGKVLS